MYFGRIHPDKGTAEAIEVAEQAGIPLVLAGIVQDQGYFDRFVTPHIDGSSVTYVGPVRAEDRSELLGEALALLHLINFDEPFGFSVIEAMACGTPVIATARGSMPEIVEHGTNGFLVSTPEEALAAVEASSDLDRSAVRRSVEHRFGIDRMVEAYLDVYRASRDASRCEASRQPRARMTASSGSRAPVPPPTVAPTIGRDLDLPAVGDGNACREPIAEVDGDAPRVVGA